MNANIFDSNFVFQSNKISERFLRQPGFFKVTAQDCPKDHTKPLLIRAVRMPAAKVVYSTGIIHSGKISKIRLGVEETRR